MRFLFGFLLFCINASGQQGLFSKDSSVFKILYDLPLHEPFDTSRNYQKVDREYVYIISDSDLYKIFGYETSVKYQDFNFTDYHIFGQQVKKDWIWQIRENKRAFNEVPSITTNGYAGIKIAGGRSSYFEDTLMLPVNNKDTARWYTHGHGDCFAYFRYGVFHDKYHPVVLLKEWNYWGGCRAGGSKAYTISFTMPRNVVQYSKNTILMNKYRDSEED
jgi:hypothetical protein